MRKCILTILISDMQGYTSRQSRSSRQAIEQLVAQHRQLVVPALRGFGGNVVKSMGDAFLATFESPTDAVLAAVQVQKVLLVQNAELADPAQAMRVRIAISTGEVSIDADGDVFGPPVNLAARVQSIAEPGSVYLTESTFLSMNQSEIAAMEVGFRVFKGIPGEVKVFKIVDGFIEAARLMSRSELEQAMPPMRVDLAATRRHPRLLLVLALVLVAIGAIGIGLRLRDPDRIAAQVEAGDLAGAASAARASFEAHPDDASARARWLDLARRELYDAEKTGRIQQLYRERELDSGWFARNVTRHAAELGHEPRFQWLLASWYMLNEPLAPDTPELVLHAIEQNLAAVRADQEFLRLLAATLEYSAKDEQAHAAYANAAARAAPAAPHP
ncbi:MAG: adenylate/guanylate cyclase domain-containing protein [Planctomycetota bacterium]